MRYMLDTNAVVGLLRNTDPVLAARTRQHDPRTICMSSIVAHELYYGAEKSERRLHNRARLDAICFEVVGFDREDADDAAQIRAALAARGLPIGPYDVLIAGQARARGLILVTHNTSEFRRVDRLRIEDWAAA